MHAPSQTAAASSKLIPAGIGASGTRLGCAHVLGVRATLDAEDAVTDVELGDGRADRHDLPGQLHAGDPPLRPGETGEGAREERMPGADSAIRPGDRRRMNFDQHLVVRRHRLLDVREPEHLRRAVAVVDDRSQSERWTVRTTLPVFCSVSTYLLASITCSSGYGDR